MNDDELAGHDDLSAHRERLKILDAMARAIDRRAELYEILDSATSAEDASTMLMRTFDVDVIQATSILDLQLRRLPRQESSQIGAERDEIRKRLGLD
jgi:DNA gyrase subunit A